MTSPRYAVEASGARRRFADGGVDDLTLTVQPGELFALLGPSGSGKTTSLRLIAGFERPDAGSLRLWDDVVADAAHFVPPERRGVGMVFQDYALFPHMSVAENVAYGLPHAAGRRTRVAEALDLVGLTGFEDRSVHDLSGGEQQRVALARALAPGPRLLLLDEPFSNLDAALRSRMRAEVREIMKRAGTTAILVTHDQEEALSVADRIAFMWRGRVEQIGPPDEVYTHPATLHVATSIGDANILRLPVANGLVHTVFGSFEAPSGTAECVLVLRPEDIQVLPGGVAGQVIGREYFGHDQVLRVHLVDGTELRVRVGAHERLGAAGPIVLGLRRNPAIFATED